MDVFSFVSTMSDQTLGMTLSEGELVPPKTTFLVILLCSFVLEGFMIAQNDTLDEAVHPRANIFFQGCQPRQGYQKTLIFSVFEGKLDFLGEPDHIH